MTENPEPEKHPDAKHTATEVSDFFTMLAGKVISGILSPDENTTWRDHARRFWIGAAGGVFYTCLKNYFGAGIGVYGNGLSLTAERGANVWLYWSLPFKCRDRWSPRLAISTKIISIAIHNRDVRCPNSINS
jgi:hypothetical protein